MSEGPSVQKVAQSAVTRLIVQVCILFITLIAIPIGAYIGDRVIKTLDKISDKQDSTKEEISKINILIANIQGDARMLNSRIDETNRNVNSRFDAISGWTRKNSDEIDKIKDWFFGKNTK